MTENSFIGTKSGTDHVFSDESARRCPEKVASILASPLICNRVMVSCGCPRFGSSWRGNRGLTPIEFFGGRLDRFDDLGIAGAAADVAGDAEADLVLARIGVLVEQRLRHHDHARGAEAALRATQV